MRLRRRRFGHRGPLRRHPRGRARPQHHPRGRQHRERRGRQLPLRRELRRGPRGRRRRAVPQARRLPPLRQQRHRHPPLRQRRREDHRLDAQRAGRRLQGRPPQVRGGRERHQRRQDRDLHHVQLRAEPGRAVPLRPPRLQAAHQRRGPRDRRQVQEPHRRGHPGERQGCRPVHRRLQLQQGDVRALHERLVRPRHQPRRHGHADGRRHRDGRGAGRHAVPSRGDQLLQPDPPRPLQQGRAHHLRRQPGRHVLLQRVRPPLLRRGGHLRLDDLGQHLLAAAPHLHDRRPGLRREDHGRGRRHQAPQLLRGGRARPPVPGGDRRRHPAREPARLQG